MRQSADRQRFDRYAYSPRRGRQDQQRYIAWFNLVDEAYVKACYSPHYDISGEALDWLVQRTDDLIKRVEVVGVAHLARIRPTR